jgi:hypothetical protein
MAARETKAELRARQLGAVRAALAQHPGLTVYRLSLAVPCPAPEGFLSGMPWHVPLTLVISLLKELGLGGGVRSEPDPAGEHWYLTGERL